MSWFRRLREDRQVAAFRKELQRRLASHYDSDAVRRFFEAAQNNDLSVVGRRRDRAPSLVNAVGVDKPAIGEAVIERQQRQLAKSGLLLERYRTAIINARA